MRLRFVVIECCTCLRVCVGVSRCCYVCVAMFSLGGFSCVYVLFQQLSRQLQIVAHNSLQSFTVCGHTNF